MTYHENINEAPEYLKLIYELVGFDYGEFSCMYEPNDRQLIALIGLLQAELAFRKYGDSL